MGHIVESRIRCEGSHKKPIVVYEPTELFDVVEGEWRPNRVKKHGRGQCPQCRENVALKSNGKCRIHNLPKSVTETNYLISVSRKLYQDALVCSELLNIDLDEYIHNLISASTKMTLREMESK